MSQYDGYAAQGISGGGLSSLTPWTENIDGAGFTLSDAVLASDVDADAIANLVRTDKANVFGDFNQIFKDDKLQIENPAGTFKVIIQSPALLADQTLNIPFLNGTKTLVVLENDQAFLGEISFLNTRLVIRNPADTFEYAIDTGAIVADRKVTIPLIAGDEIFVLEALAQTLTNKTIDGDDNTLQDIDFSSLADGVDGELITWDASGVIDTVAVGTVGQVLTSGGVGVAPTFQAAVSGEFFGPWTANHDAGDFDLLNVKLLEINNPADTFQYIITGAAIIADRVLTLPLLTGPDTVVTEAFAQPITNKTFPGTNPNEFEDDGLVIQNLAGTFKYTIQAGELLSDRILSLPVMTVDSTLVVLDKAQTFLGLITFPTSRLLLRNPADTFNFSFLAGAIAADRSVTIPAIGSNDVFVMEAFGQTLTNKTLGSSTSLGATLDAAGNDIDNLQNLINDLSTSGTDIDFDEDQLQEISIAANTTFTGVNYAIGKSKTVKITTDGSLRTLAFPNDWVFVGSKPTDQQASKTGILSLTSFTAAEAGVVAAYAVEA